MGYIDVATARKTAGIEDNLDDDALRRAIDAATSAIDAHCKRTFTKDDVATARLFRPLNAAVCHVDDFWTTSDLVVKLDTGTGTYSTTLSDYVLEPLNGRMDGMPWPYTKVVAINRPFPSSQQRPAVQVTAKWGWPEVPAAVVEACSILVGWLCLGEKAPGGVAGFGDFGPLRIRDHPVVTTLLRPFVLEPAMVG